MTYSDKLDGLGGERQAASCPMMAESRVVTMTRTVAENTAVGRPVRWLGGPDGVFYELLDTIDLEGRWCCAVHHRQRVR